MSRIICGPIVPAPPIHDFYSPQRKVLVGENDTQHPKCQSSGDQVDSWMTDATGCHDEQHESEDKKD